MRGPVLVDLADLSERFWVNGRDLAVTGKVAGIQRQ
jgi:hypothetical protein